METTNNKLTTYQNIFFNNLSNYLDTKLYFFGSVQRFDYFPNSSDIDITIFTDNHSSTVLKLIHFLDIDKSKVKKIVWNLSDKIIINGFKINYKDLDNDINIDSSIYDEKYKDIILNEHNSKKEIPLYATFLLVILKFCYYKLKIVSKNIYVKTKRFILNTLLKNKDDNNFVMI
jgi:predicted nucleotidyltransferase